MVVPSGECDCYASEAQATAQYKTLYNTSKTSGDPSSALGVVG